MIILAFDPGTHTGFAHYDTTRPTEAHALTITANSPDDNADAYRDLWLVLMSAGEYKLHGISITVVIERFTTVHSGVAASKDGIFTQKLCGFLEGTALNTGLTVVWHASSVRKAFEDRAKELLANRKPTPHEISAMSHALAYADRIRTQGNAASDH